MTLPTITDFQEWVLRDVRRKEIVGRTPPLVRDVSASLFESDQNRYATRFGARWTSRAEAANPHVSSLVRKGLVTRPERGHIATTALGRKWLKANPAPTG